MSESASGLMPALLAVQEKAPKLLKSSEANAGSFSYKYVDLAAVMESVGPLLTEHGLVWSTFPTIDEQGRPALRYRITHAATGESEQDTMPLMLSKSDAQGQGSAITYARRYSITAVLNLIADEDDDGRAAGQPQGQQSGEKLASENQKRLIFARTKDAGIPNSVLANIMKITAGQEATLFETEAEAEAWIERALPRLPARLVNPIVENIAAEKVLA